MICVAIKGPSYEEAHAQIAQALQYADLVELRLDYFNKIDRTAIKNLNESFSIPMIFALKGKIQGGFYPSSEEQRLSDIRMLATLNPSYLDLESNLPAVFVKEIAEKHPQIKIIISYHDFNRTPDQLDEIYQNMQDIPADFYKIALKANSTLDAMHLICWAKKLKKNILAVSMGLQGHISRILQPVVGGKFTYASLEDDLQTAPGQLTARTLDECYYYHSLNPQTLMFGLIGDPVDKSLSHQTHNYYFRRNGLNAVYVKMQVKAEELTKFFQLAKELPFRGLSVTMPLKESIIPFLDEIDPQAQMIGACNTLLFDNGKIKGCNTDSIGALNAIEQLESVKGKRIVIIGAGGAAKAVIYEACLRKGQVTILNRDETKALQTAAHFGCRGAGLDKMAECYESGYDILINCTPIEMPIEARYLNPKAIIMDIKTRPKDTELLKCAREMGCRIVYGYQMFIEQAIGQFNYWFKDQIDPDECRQILEKKVLKGLKG